MVVPIIKMIGLTMGLTVWGVTNMLSGWFSGRYLAPETLYLSSLIFSSFHLPPPPPRVILKQEVECEKLNYGGVATVVIRSV